MTAVDTVDLRDRIARLPAEKRALLERRLAKKSAPTARRSAIERRPFTGPSPLSFAQQRLWLLDQVEAKSAAYNIALASRLTGPLNGEALRMALDALVDRHEILRTSFRSEGGNPVQVISDTRSASLAHVDLSACDVGEREAALQASIAAESRRPFDLARGPLLRATLIRLGDDEHVLVLVMHHIVSDGWSLGILHRELTALYCAYAEGRLPALRELPIQYADFARWQRDRLQGDELERHLAYFREQLAGAPLVLELPTDRLRPRSQSFRGAGIGRQLSPRLTKLLRALGHHENATLFMTLLAAFATLLHRYSGLDDILVGSPFAGRTRGELEHLIGLFVNTVVLRTDLSGDPTFRELLGRVRETTLGAHGHQDLPFEKLVEVLQPDRDSSRSPVVQVMFALQTVPAEASAQTRLLQSSVDTGTSKFDLTLFVTETDDRLSCWFEYCVDLFDAASIERMARHFEVLLEGIVTNPDRRLSELPLLEDAERHQLVSTWNSTERAFSQHRCIHELFDEQVERAPDAVAVVAGDQQVSYRELQRRANQLAHRLIRLGVGPDVLVGVRMERSLNLIVGLLAILKAGGAYVPLDLDYPPERQWLMLTDAQIGVLLTDHGPSLTPVDADVHVINVNAEARSLAHESDANPSSNATADHLAYVIYTSGSTGQPKGVAVPHRAVNRLVLGTDYVQLGPSDVVAQASNSSFDAATFEIWGAFLNGARLVLVSKEVLLAPAELATAIERHGIGIMFVTTALFNQLASEQPTIFHSLKQVMFGGEAVDPQSVRRVLRSGPPRHLVHVYGPTETTTFATWHPVLSVPDEATTIPIGRPIANTQAYVLDRHLNPQPVGVPGELYLGGPGLARGYLHRPDLTAERFIPSPFTANPDARLYRTGDLVRRLADGSIEFVGRLDQQVKIRGFRIELGEIEAVLGEHPAVRQSIVVAYESGQTGKRLAAYIVPTGEGGITTDEVRRHLRQKLPEYMVPTAILLLSNLPLNANGKIERGALPSPALAAPGECAPVITPSNAVEAQLVQLWEQLLDVSRVSITDNFFSLGGHSLLVVQLLAEIAKRFGTKVSLASFFQNATIQDLARTIANGQTTAEDAAFSSLVPIQQAGNLPPLFCVHPLGGDVLCYHSLSRRLGPNQPVYGLQARGIEDAQPPIDDMREMAAFYIEQIRTVQPEGPYYLLGFSSGGTVVFEMAQQLRAAGHTIGILAILDHPSVTAGYYRPLVKPAHWPALLYDLLAYRDKVTAPRLDHVRRLATSLRTWFRRRHDGPRPAHDGDAAQHELDAIVDYVARNIAGDPKLLPHRHREVIAAQYRALTSYTPSVYPGHVTLFRARRQPLLCSHDPMMGWGALASEGVTVCTVPGSHLGVLQEPKVATLAERLETCLARARGVC
ncbi:MAG: amino acid adenylation domain-containing protein [Chloroflexota bacterium]